MSAKQPKNEKQYGVRNWADYNARLVQRGSITLWINGEVLAAWQPTVEGPRQRGGHVQYSDRAIACVRMGRAVFKLTLRATEGFGRRRVALLGAQVPIPDYTTLCKRSATLSVKLPVVPSQEPLPIIIDSPRLKIYGEGEWKVRQYGYRKRRTWRKLPLSVEEATQQIQAVVLTEADGDDAQAGKQVLEQTTGPIDQVSADGAYHKRKFYDAGTDRHLPQSAMPPGRDARSWPHGNSSKPPLPRDENLRRIRRLARPRWKVVSAYTRRSLAETAVFRFKTIFGATLASRTLPRQITEARIRAEALNRMTALGMPDSYPLA